MRVLPGAPGRGSPVADLWVRVVQQPAVRRREVAVAGRRGTASRNAPTARGRRGRRRGRATRRPARRLVTAAVSTIPVTRSGCALRVGERERGPPRDAATSHRSMPRCSRSRSRSATRWAVVLARQVGVGSPACGVLRRCRAGRAGPRAGTHGGSNHRRRPPASRRRPARPCRRPPRASPSGLPDGSQ